MLKNFQIKGAPTCRVAYPQTLFEKKAIPGVEGQPKYNAIILVPKDDKEKIEQINEAFAEAFKELQNSGFRGKSPANINPKNVCWVDGETYADESDNREWAREYMVLKVASRNYRPIVCDKTGLTILNGVDISGLPVEKISPEKLESGDYIFANICFWTYNKAAAGIGCNINAVIRAGAGEPIGAASGDVKSYIDMGEYA